LTVTNALVSFLHENHGGGENHIVIARRGSRKGNKGKNVYQCHHKHGPWTRNICINQELVRNTNSQTSAELEIETGVQKTVWKWHSS
jgi:hypothetical protein